MQNRRRKITSEMMTDVETGGKESRFSRTAMVRVIAKKSGARKMVKVVRGKLTGRTKGAFGRNPLKKKQEDK